MLLEDARTIASFADYLEVYAEYSGRGMFGEKTAGVVGGQAEINGAIAMACATEGIEFAKRMRYLQWDSLGKSDSIVY